MAKASPLEAFERRIVVLPLTGMLLLREIEKTKQRPRYKRIAQSIEEVGLVEPLVVCRKADEDGAFLLLDGHLRRAALLDQGKFEASCILACSDEAFTYNARVNQVSTVQEHFMIVRALERGVSEQKLARALNVDIQHVRRRVGLLNGICQGAVDSLADKAVNPVTFDALRKMRPERQVEACNLMVSASNFSSSYAKALLAGSKNEDLKSPPREKRPVCVIAADLTLLEREMAKMQREFVTVESSYGRDMLTLTIASSYLKKLIENSQTACYLKDNHPEILEKFRDVAAGE